MIKIQTEKPKFTEKNLFNNTHTYSFMDLKYRRKGFVPKEY